MKLRKIILGAVASSISVASVFFVGNQLSNSLFFMPSEYKRIRNIVDKLSKYNDLGDNPISFTITAGSYAHWRAKELSLCIPDSCYFYMRLNPYKHYSNVRNHDINEINNQAYLYGGVDATAYETGTVSISRSTFRILKNKEPYLACVIAHEIAHILNHQPFEMSKYTSSEREGDKEMEDSAYMRFRRESELRADKDAAFMVENTGYPKDTCTDTLFYLYNLYTKIKPETKKDSHPSLQKRLDNLRNLSNKEDNYIKLNNAIKSKFEYSSQRNFLKFSY